jgi:hypothetical protein
MNDTGSNIMSLFDTDIQYLGNLQGYTGWLGHIAVRDASGTINRYRRVHVQVQLTRDDDSPWSGWINERAIVKPSSPNVPRLSGIGIRKVLYLGTAPGNHLGTLQGQHFRSTFVAANAHCPYRGFSGAS